MRICIINANIGGNKGAEAMVLVLIQELVKSLDKKITNIYIEESIPKNSPIVEEILKLDKRIAIFKYNVRSFKPFSINLKKVDYIIDISGISFVDSTIKAELRNFLKFLFLFKHLRKTIFFTQDFGPTLKSLNRFFAKVILTRSKAIYCRSSYSENNLKNNVSENLSFKGIFPDSTFALEPKGNENLKKQKDYIILSPSSIMYNNHGEKYLSLFEQFYSKFNDLYDIYFLNHTYTTNGNTSDKVIINNLYKRCDGSKLIDDDTLLASELKYFISNAQFVITSRYHVLVGAMSKCVPTIALGWNPKYESFLSLYNQSELAINDIPESPDSIIDLIGKINCEENRKRMEETNLHLKRKVEEGFLSLMEML